MDILVKTTLFNSSTVNRQLSTVNHQPSTVNRQPSTVNYQLSTLNMCPAPLTSSGGEIFTETDLMMVLIYRDPIRNSAKRCLDLGSMELAKNLPLDCLRGWDFFLILQTESLTW